MATAADALRKLTSGAKLTDAEKVLLNISTATKKPAATPVPVPFKVTPIQPLGTRLEPGQAGFVGPVAMAPAVTPIPVIPEGTGTGASAITVAKDNILAATLKSYGMDGVGATIAKIRAENPEIPQDDLLFLLKNDPRYNAEYLARFSGNKLLKERGLPTIDDAQYLLAEKEYEKIFTAYGATNLANRKYYGELMANRMDAKDVSERLDIAYEVYKGSPEIKQAFSTFYGTITDGEIIGAMLSPDTEIPLLEKKVRVANIGAAALVQKLDTSLAKAEDLEAYGITTAQAQAGYSTIGQGLSGYEKILEMNRGVDVKTTDVQTQLESSVLKKKAKDIADVQTQVGVEVARFGGSSGRLASRDRAQGLI